MPLTLFPPGRELDPWDDQDASLGAKLDRLGNRPHRVVIADGNNAKALFRQVLDQLLRSPAAIARTSMQVNVDRLVRSDDGAVLRHTTSLSQSLRECAFICRRKSIPPQSIC